MCFCLLQKWDFLLSILNRNTKTRVRLEFLCEGWKKFQPFAYPKGGEDPPQKLRWRKQRQGLLKIGFEKSLQEYTCERSVNFGFSMDMGGTQV